jgi:hypothetical protein
VGNYDKIYLMTLIKPQLRCTEAGLLTFESVDETPIGSQRSRDDWLELGSLFLPIWTNTVDGVTTVGINLRDEKFQEEIARRPGIPTGIGLTARLINELIIRETRDDIDPVVKFLSFNENSIIGGIYSQMQKYLCDDGVSADVARSAIDVMSLVYGQEINQESLANLEIGDNFYRGGYFSVSIDDVTFTTHEEKSTKMLKWPTVCLQTLGDSTTFGNISRPVIDVTPDKRYGEESLYTQSFSNVDDYLDSLSLAVGLARLADAAANHVTDIDLFSDDFKT